MEFLLQRYIPPIFRLLTSHSLDDAGMAEMLLWMSGVTIWSKIGFVVDFRNLLFGRDFDVAFSKGYSLMKFLGYTSNPWVQYI